MLGCLVVFTSLLLVWPEGIADISLMRDADECRAEQRRPGRAVGVAPFLLQTVVKKTLVPDLLAAAYVQIEVSKQHVGSGRPLLKRGTASSSLGSPAGNPMTSLAGNAAKTLAGEVMTGAFTNVAFSAIGSLPFMQGTPIGDFLGAGDISNNDLYDRISGDLKAGFADVKNALNNMGEDLKAHVTGEVKQQTEALSELMAENTESVLLKLTANAQENRELLSSFRHAVEKNHQETMQVATEHMFQTSYRQCLEYSTDIITKYRLYTIMLEDMLYQRQQTLSAFRPGDFGSVHGCSAGWTDIYSEGLCREAAAALEYEFKEVNSWDHSYPGCWTEPSSKRVFFNTHPTPAGTWPPSAGQLCKHAQPKLAFEPGKFGTKYGCRMGYSGIYSEGLCREAAAALGYNFIAAGAWPGDYPGCMVQPSNKRVLFNTHADPAGTDWPDSMGQLCQNDGTDKRIALMSLKEADMLHSFFSNSGMGTVADAQRLMSCFLQTQHDARSLVGKYIQTFEPTTDTTFDAAGRLSAQSLMLDLIETSMLAVDMQDMQLAVVDHFSMRARLEYAADVGQQLDEAWALLRQELHASQPQVKFLSHTATGSLSEDVVVVEHGSCPGPSGARCLDSASSSAFFLDSANRDNVDKDFLEAKSISAINKCVAQPGCREVIVWATKHCGEDTRNGSPWLTKFQWSPSSVIRASGCGSAYPNVLNLWSEASRVTYSSWCRPGQNDDGAVVAFAAFYIRHK